MKRKFSKFRVAKNARRRRRQKVKAKLASIKRNNPIKVAINPEPSEEVKDG